MKGAYVGVVHGAQVRVAICTKVGEIVAIAPGVQVEVDVGIEEG